MSSLTDLLVSEVERCRQERDAVLAKQDEKKAVGEQRTRAVFQKYLDKWAPFRELLGLKREPVINRESLRIEWQGTSAINNLPIKTLVSMPIIDPLQAEPMLKIQIWLAEDERVYSTTAMESSLDGAEYPGRLGRLCSLLMERYAQQRAEDIDRDQRRAQALAMARGYIEIAKTYTERYERAKARARRWAEEWSKKLWEPHELWRVRYRAVGDNVDTESAAESIVVMESPDDILTALHEFTTATVTKVYPTGDAKEIAIASFLDAEMISINAHELELPMVWHRRHSAMGYFVNVPAHVNETPAKGPDIIPWYQYVEECCADPQQLGQIDPAHVATLTPEAFIEEYRWWPV